MNEVTQADYMKVMGTNPSHHAPTGAGKELVAGMKTNDHPVEMVSWNEAADFCAKLSQQEMLKPFYFRAEYQGGVTVTPLDGTGYRLPSEAEWEFACRAGTTTKYWISNQDEDLARVGWFNRNSGGRTHSAGELKANPFGLNDIHGNVLELVQDGWDETQYSQFQDTPAINPNTSYQAKPYRVIRGGLFEHDASSCRSSGRNATGPSRLFNHVGFRVSLPVDAVRQALKVQEPALPSQAMSNTGSGTLTTAATKTWHGWPADAPAPAIAPFDAAQARKHQEAWAKYLKVPVEYTNSIGMKFILIPPGEFTMGSTAEEIQWAFKQDSASNETDTKSEGPQHKVILTRPFFLGIYEVTQGAYQKVMGTNPSAYSPTGMLKEAVAGIETIDHPVEKVNWFDAAEFCAKLSQQEKWKPFYFRALQANVTPLDGTGYRLPSEAEWEYACRAGTTTRYWPGDEENDLAKAGWYHLNAGDRTHAAGELKPNPFGLYDIHGNVWEWVEDGHHPKLYDRFREKAAVDPRGEYINWPTRVLRGGALNPVFFCRSSIRASSDGGSGTYETGFRVALPVDTVRKALKVDGPPIPERSH